MKVIYAEPGENPVDVARQHFKRRGAGGLGGSAWLVVAVVVFVAFGFVAGPFKGDGGKVTESSRDKTETVAGSPVEAASNLLDGMSWLDEFCKLPAGGSLAPGDTAWITDGAQYLQVRCEREGLVELPQQETP